MEIKIKMPDYKARWWKYYLQSKYSNKKSLESNIKLAISKIVDEVVLKELEKVRTNVTVNSLADDIGWHIIKEIGWGTKSTDYEELGKFIKNNYTKIEIKNLHEFVGTKVEILYALLDNNNIFLGIGDDSKGDLLKHIVGLGKEEYEKVCKNPKLIERRAKKRDFVECFTYVFH